MSFVRLAITNVRRNMGRSLLSIIGMALAAMILSSTLPVAQGYPKEVDKVYRQFIGGDILVYPGRFQPGRAEMSAQRGPDWRYDRLPPDFLSDLNSLHPEYFTQGFLRKATEGRYYFDWNEIVKSGISRKNYIAGMSLYQSLPALVRWVDKKGTDRAWFSPLRSRDPLVDKDYDFDEIVTAGRAFIRCDDGKFHCLIDGRRQYLRGYEQMAVGSTLMMEVPLVKRDASGNYFFDYTVRKSYEFKVVGRYALPTRVLMWSTEMGNQESEQLYWTTPQILIPQMTLAKIWHDVSGADSPPVSEIAVRVNNMAFLENDAADLATTLPGHTVISVPAQVKAAATRDLPEPHFRFPGQIAGPEDIRQSGAPMDLRSVVVILTYSIAALLVASNMLIALAQRRREIGILKALGAKSREIMTMVVSEVIFVSVFGAVSGFVLIRSASLWTYLSNRMPVLQIGALTMSDFFRVIFTTLAFALVFSVLPAIQTLRMSPMEVLRNE